ncbi:MAG TPA: YlmH/Sll1252 family protein [Selenomonadales bacterium]|nr:YlmH/Sll1252 family protein [Selenomonadales bacterium]
MSERDKILRYYRASGDADLAARLIDLAEGALRGRRYKVSEFLDPYGLSVAETVAAHFERVKFDSEGGYSGAERVRTAFIEEDFRGAVDFGIAALSCSVDVRYYSISHRDVLGAVLGLGIKREMVGDIIMNSRGCQLICDGTMTDFIRQHLVKIGAAPVEVGLLPLDAIAPKEEKIKEIRTTVASLRLDTIAAAGFGTSRTRMAEEIAADKVKVNWQDARNSSQALKAGDVISMRGRGRVEVSEVLGQTKKGRISIFLKRFI